MPKDYCFICASDEGIFVDITVDNKESFYTKLETCFIIKVEDVDTCSKKICHKCVYELDQCYSFIQKYKEIHLTKPIKKILNTCCILCLKPGKKGYIFDLSKDNSFIYQPFYKLCKLFSTNFQKYEVLNKLICLTCRYTLDILFDLKTVFHEVRQNGKDVINENIDYSNFPKVKTRVINRKTTTTGSTNYKVQNSSDSDSDLSIMARGHSRTSKLNNKKLPGRSKFRTCNKCHNTVKNGEDMYRFYRTGLTVCKICWSSMDPSKRLRKQLPRTNSKKTKLCYVFLKDILTDATFKEEKLYRVEQDDHGNKVFIVTDETSESEGISHKISDSDKTSADEETSTARKHGKKHSVSSIELESTDNEDKPNKKRKLDQRQMSKDSNNLVALGHTVEKIPKTEAVSTRQKAKRLKSNQNSDSDISVSTMRSTESMVVTRRRKASGLSVSDAEVENKHNRKKLKIIFEGIAVARNLVVSDETSSTECRQRNKRKGRFASVSPVGTPISHHTKDTKNSRTRSNSISSRATTQRMASRYCGPERLKAQKPTAFKEKVESKSKVKEEMEENTTYTCGECGMHCETKLMSMTHKLSHFKQPKLELRQVEVPIIKVESVELEVLSTSDQAEKLCDEQSDEIEINVEDDEEESVMLTTNDSNSKDETVPLTHSSDKSHLIQEKIENTTSTVNVTETEKETIEEEKTGTVTDSTEGFEIMDDININSVEVTMKSDPVLKLSTIEDDNEDLKENTESESNQNEENNKEGNNDKYNKESKSNEHGEDSKECQDNMCKEDDQKSTEPREFVDDVQEADKALEQEVDDGETNSTKQLGLADKQEKEQQKVEEKEEEKVDDEEKEMEVEGEKKEMKELEIDLTKSLTLSKSEIVSDLCDSSLGGEEAHAAKEEKQNKHNGENVQNKTDVNVTESVDSEKNTEQRVDLNCSRSENINKENEVMLDEMPEVVEVPEEFEKTEEEKLLDDSNKSTLMADSASVEKADSNATDANAISEDRIVKDSEDVAAQVLQEVFDLATAEVQKRQDSVEVDTKKSNNLEEETLENISREIQNSADMPSLDPISGTEADSNDVSCN